MNGFTGSEIAFAAGVVLRYVLVCGALIAVAHVIAGRRTPGVE